MLDLDGKFVVLQRKGFSTTLIHMIYFLSLLQSYLLRCFFFFLLARTFSLASRNLEDGTANAQSLFRRSGLSECTQNIPLMLFKPHTWRRTGLSNKAGRWWPENDALNHCGDAGGWAFFDISSRKERLKKGLGFRFFNSKMWRKGRKHEDPHIGALKQVSK